MLYAVMLLVGVVFGAGITFVLLDKVRKQWKELEARTAQMKADAFRLDLAKRSMAERDDELRRQAEQLTGRKITYETLMSENLHLKRQLVVIDVGVNKAEIDADQLSLRQRVLDGRATELAERYLKETEKWVIGSVNAQNYTLCKQRLMKVVEWCREIGFDVSKEKETQLLADLKEDFEKAVRAALQREEQARIKAAIREEQMREKEVQRELQAVEREKAVLQEALMRALAATDQTHSEEIANLRARLAAAESRERSISQAQLTKAGHIYVISNIGAFGEGVFKIGMTRRLQPADRIDELGDASVPFPFDVHLMISCTNAPELERAMHQEFATRRLNKVNPRKEYFSVSLDDVVQFVTRKHGKVDFRADAEAIEFRQSTSMSAAQQAEIDAVFEKIERQLGLPESEE